MCRIIHILLFSICIAILPSSCGDRKTVESKPVCKVNDYVITEEDFRRALSESALYQSQAGLTQDNRKSVLDEQIRKELLIQTAVNLGLDKEAEFRQTIERYWEQTLIATLIKMRCAQVGNTIFVSREDIENRYRELAAANAGLPALEEMAPALATEILEEKKSKALDDWTEELRKNASIRIYEENLSAIR